MVKISKEDLRRYARRDWGAPERLARRLRANQPIALKVTLGIELYEAARGLQPDWPDERTRRRDLDAHIQLRARLNQATHVGAG